ncbi:MAG: hypothetical protein WCK01_02195 [Candidatus Uhrbacteria bacterium]
MENPFLIKKYPDLSGSKPVESAVKKARKSGEKIRDNSDRVQAYLSRLERLVLNPDEARAGRAVSLLREMVMNEYVRPQKTKLARAAAVVEERAARQMGIPVEYGEEQLEQRGEIAVKDLENSLDQWINYLSDPNEPYPTWFRYYAFRNILGLGEYDKDKKEFLKRSAGTNRLFPDIDRGALARTQDLIECAQNPEALLRYQELQKETQTPADELLTAQKAKQFANLPFAKQYAESIEAAGEITPELRAETRGEWVTYSKGTEPKQLWKSLQNKGTAWCTKGFATATRQLEGGDFHVYYTLDATGAPTIPRIAIRMEQDVVGEVRGVADTAQNLEGNMNDIAMAKLGPLPGAERYLKVSANVKRVTDIEKNIFLNEPLSVDELRFLYEFDAEIELFGYGPYPHIDQIRDQRDRRADLRTIYDCTEEELQEKEYVTLKNIPKWKELPDEKIFKNDFKFHGICESEYRAGRPIEDFQIQIKAEVISVAKVFDISDAIARAHPENPRHSRLTNSEVLKVIEEAGYRSATLEELVAYARDYWKPDADPKTLTVEERFLQNAQAIYIVGLGGVFTDENGDPYAPCLTLDGRIRRCLDLIEIDDSDWPAAFYFLVLRKFSS